jgi:hypothetical protein
MKCTNVWCVRFVSVLAAITAVLVISVLLPTAPASAYICGSTPILYNTCDASCENPGASAPDCPWPNWKCMNVTVHTYVQLAETHLYERTGTYQDPWSCWTPNCPSFCN